MGRNICQLRPDVILFAGRSHELAQFIEGLAKRNCLDSLPLTIIAGADTVEFARIAQENPSLLNGLKANMRVTYTTQAHPGSWLRSPESFNPEAIKQLGVCNEGCYDNFFPGKSLDDGAAIMGYDATVIAATAIRPPDGGSYTEPDLVSGAFSGMRGTEAVAGASGYMSLSYGHPVNKAVAILGLQDDGTVEFLELGSPDGRPCVPGDMTRRC